MDVHLLAKARNIWGDYGSDVERGRCVVVCVR